MINYSKPVEDTYNTTAKSGFPSPALDYLEETIDLNKELIDHPLSTFFMEYRVSDMVQAFVPEGAKLIIDRSRTPENGDMVLCVINRKFRVRFLKKNNLRAWLFTADKKKDGLELCENDEIRIWGVITNVIIESKKIKQCMP